MPARERQMKNWLPAESGSASRAIEITPKSWGSELGSSGSQYPGPPSPVPVGSPPWMTNGSLVRASNGTMRWKITPS